MAELNFFFRGPYASYSQEVHGQGIYFATDKGIIKMGGKDYIGPLGDSTAVKSIALNADGSKFVITYLDGRLLIECMEYAAILYVDAIADAYTVDIATQYGIEPYAAVAPHHHIADDCSIIGQKTVLSNLGRKSPNRFHQCHEFLYIYIYKNLLGFYR